MRFYVVSPAMKRFVGGEGRGALVPSIFVVCLCRSKEGAGDASAGQLKGESRLRYTHPQDQGSPAALGGAGALAPRLSDPLLSSSTWTCESLFLCVEDWSRGRRAGQVKSKSRLRYSHPQDQGSLAALAGANALVSRLSDPLLLHLDLDMRRPCSHALSLRDLVPAQAKARDQRCPAA